MRIEDLLEIYKSGRKEEACAEAARIADSEALDEIQRIELGIFIYKASQAKERLRVGCRLLAPYIENPLIPSDVVARVSAVAWLSGDIPTTVRAARIALRENPNLGHLYKILGMGLLCEHQYESAMFAFIAGMGMTNDPHGNESWARLARALWKGVKEVTVPLLGKRYKFGLDIFGQMTIEAANSHINGLFTEPEELKRLAECVRRGCRIVEMGTLVGNHTLFFMGELEPSSMVLIDGSQQALDVTRANIVRNHGETWPCDIRFVHRFVGRDSRMCQFQGCEVQQDNLDTILKGTSFDFIKIDADGNEVELLAGAMDILTANKPDMMLEVEKQNRPSVEEKLFPLGYRILWSVDHGSYENHFLRVG